MSAARARLGLVGFGYLGSYVYQQVSARPELGLDVAFVHDGDAARLAALPPELVLGDLAGFAERRPDLVVELAHPEISRRWGRAFLERADYMPLSLTALADADLERDLVAAARARETRLFIPHGAIVGIDALEEGRALWEEVSIRMVKPLRSLDFTAAPHLGPGGITGQTVLYDGPTRGICPLFPRNVNSHAAVALAGIGFDRTRSVLVADPALEVSIIEVEARGGGVAIQVRRENPMKGVSGVLTLAAVLGGVVRARGTAPGLAVC
ncbi:MAG: aspartate dehydrogenase domain-containing protein [Gemmatimonadota bacterium]